jgi:2-keto-3-deoxy-L-fuconate dehydrogenase
MDLTGKRVLITAAAQGIGQASVEAYLNAGAEVFAVDINGAALDSLQGVHKHVLDVTDHAAIERLAAHHRHPASGCRSASSSASA